MKGDTGVVASRCMMCHINSWYSLLILISTIDTGIVSRSSAGLARMMTVIVEVFGAFGLTVSEKKTETLLMRAPEKAQQPGETPTPSLPALEIAAAGQKYHQVHQFVYTWAASLPKTPTSHEISAAAPKSLGDVLGSFPQSSSTGQTRH